MELQTQQEIQHIEERREARFNAYIRNTMHAVEDGDFDIAEFELNKAELIRISSETRSLRNAIRDGRKRGHLIHLAHVFLEENNYKEAVEHAERANEIAATEDVELLIRQIRCQMLISEACELEAAGQNAKAVLLLKTALWLHEDRRAREMLNRLEGSPATQPAEDGKR